MARRRNIASLMRARGGAVAAEFALIVPVLFATLFATIEYGMVMFSYNSMQLAAARVARMVAVNTVTTDAAATTAAKGMLPDWFGSSAVVTVNQTAAGNPLLNRITVRVAVPVVSATPFPLFTMVSPWTMTTQVSVDQEIPYA